MALPPQFIKKTAKNKAKLASVAKKRGAKKGKFDPKEPDQDDKPRKKGQKKQYDPKEPDSDDA